MLPINNQPEVVRKALSAGKHVLSEKPVAKDVATAKELVGWYRSLSNPPIWAVAENFRYTLSLTEAAKAVKDLGGKVLTFHLKRYGFVKEDDKYFNTECECTLEVTRFCLRPRTDCVSLQGAKSPATKAASSSTAACTSSPAYVSCSTLQERKSTRYRPSPACWWSVSAPSTPSTPSRRQSPASPAPS